MEKHLFNPTARLGLRLGIAPRHFALLETTGRKTGRRRQTPVGGALLDGAFWLVSEHGDGCNYIKNLLADPSVRVKIGRAWHAGRATVMHDDEPFARHRRITNANGWVGRADGVFFRAGATTPASVRIELDTPPAPGQDHRPSAT
jgi:deazaflavin-dependent oxidoreductase (nitroreductase family)